MSGNLENKRYFQENLLFETQQDFADVAYQFYQLFSKKYPNFPAPNSLDFSEIASYLDPRKGGSLEYGKAEPISDIESQQLVFDTAEKLGFVSKKIVKPNNKLEEKLEISSDLVEYDGDVEALVVPGGAGQTLIKRTYYALEAIRLGKVKTNNIYLLTGEREVALRENDLLVKNGFTPGQSEFDLAQGAISDLLPDGLENLTKEKRTMVLGGDDYQMNIISGSCSVGSVKNVNIVIINSPFDRKRVLEDGTPAKRAITEETFAALSQFLGDFNTNKTLYLVSHDIYQPAQMLFAQKVFGKEIGRNIVGSGPVDINRVWKNSHDEFEMNGHEAVLSEINKYFNVICRFYRELQLETEKIMV